MLLFAALFMTSAAAFVAGNVLLLDPAVVRSSAPIAGVVLLWVFTFYALSSLCGSVILGLVAALLLILACGQIPAPAAAGLFSVIGFSSAVFSVFSWRKVQAPYFDALLMSVVGAATVFSVFHQVYSFDMLAVAKTGWLHKDVAFHGAIAAMIKHYGVVSTGLHGLVETPYYVFSHAVIAAVSTISGQPVLETSGVLTFVLFNPLLLFAVAFAALQLPRASSVSVPAVWCAVCLCLVITPLFLSRWMVMPWYFSSQSYTMSLVVLCAALPLLYKRVDNFSSVLLLVIAVIAIGYTKASSAVLFSGLICANWLFSCRGRFGLGAMAAVSCLAVAVWCAFFGTSAAGTSQRWEFLHFVTAHSWHGEALGELLDALQGKEPLGGISILLAGGGALASFLLFHFLFSWIALYLIRCNIGSSGLFSNPVAVSVWASVAGGALFVAALARTNGSDVYWFSNISFFVALPVVAQEIVGAVQRRTRWRIIFCLLALLAICLSSYKSYYQQSRLAPSKSANHAARLVDYLVALNRTVPVNSALRSSTDAWRWEPIRWNKVPWHSAAPFFYPAISERPWINVIRPEIARDPYIDYAYSKYAIDPVSGGVRGEPILLPGMATVDVALPEVSTE